MSKNNLAVASSVATPSDTLAQTAKDKRIAELEAQLAAAQAKAGKAGAIRFKVGEKGGLSMYNIGSARFPVTLYKAQWLRLLDMADEIRRQCQNPALSNGKDDPRFPKEDAKTSGGF